MTATTQAAPTLIKLYFDPLEILSQHFKHGSLNNNTMDDNINENREQGGKQWNIYITYCCNFRIYYVHCVVCTMYCALCISVE